MEIPLPATLPASHREFLIRAVETLSQDSRILAVAAYGSFVTDSMDEFSDLDLVMFTDNNRFLSVQDTRLEIAASLGNLLTIFTGEHVGQPGLILALYGPPLIHVDLLIDRLDRVTTRSDPLTMLWQRNGPPALPNDDSDPAAQNGPDLQRIEDRFWGWIHKGAGKIGRGELFEAIEYLAFLRRQVLGPLALAAVGATPVGLKGIEKYRPDLLPHLEQTIAGHSAEECFGGLRIAVELYVKLRAPEGPDFKYRREAQHAVLSYLEEIEAALKNPEPTA